MPFEEPSGETPGEALRRVRLESDMTGMWLGALLKTSPSMITYVENNERKLPRRWLPKLPPEFAIPVIDALIRQLNDEYANLWELREAKMNEPRPGGPTETPSVEDGTGRTQPHTIDCMSMQA
jgi:hypothetical protein